MSGGTSERRGGLVRDWWWTPLPLVVILSIGVSAIVGGPTARPERGAGVAVRSTDRTASVLHGVPHRIPLGHPRPVGFDFLRCIARHQSMHGRKAQRYCLRAAHLSTG